MEQDCFEWAETIQEELVCLTLTDRDFFVRSLTLLKPYYFTLKLFQEVTAVSQDHFKKYQETITLPVLTEEIRRSFEGESILPSILEKLPYLMEPRVSAQKSREYLLGELQRFAKMQAMKGAILQSVEELKQQNYGKIENLIRGALEVGPEPNLGQNYFEDLKDRYKRELQGKDSEKFTTGFSAIDNELGGGLGRKELGMIYAPPGVGKSLWLVKVGASNLLKGKKVLYFSLEMAEDRIAARFDSVLALVPPAQRVSNFIQMEKRLEKVRSITGPNLQIKEYPTGSADVNTLRSYIVSLQNRKGWIPDIILLDYADLMMPIEGRGLETWQKQQRIYEEVRGFASEGNYCIFTASQSNRMARQVQIITDNELGDSYGKLRVVDAAWSINCTLPEKERSVGRIFVVKHRNAKSQYIIPMRFDYQTLRLLEVTSEEYDNLMKGGTV